MGEQIQRADAGEIIAAVERMAKEPKLIIIKGLDGKDVEVLAIPSGPGAFRLEATKQFQAGAQTGVQPHTGTARVTRIESFFDHVNRFKSDASVVFADVERGDPQLLAVLDYHDVKSPPDRWGGRHRTLYPFPVSEEMQAWGAIDGKPMNMITFARFIEGRLPDIFPPGDPGLDDRVKDFAVNLRVRLGAAQEMYDLAHGIEINVRNEVVQAVKTSSSEGQISYREVHTDAAGAELRFPGAFCIAIPIFTNGPLYQIPVRISHDFEKGKGVMWTLDLFDLELVKRDAIDQVCARVGEMTELPVIFGTPES